MASPNIDVMLVMPSMIANVRISRLFQSHARPSFRSAIKVGFWLSAEALGASFLGIRMLATSAAASANDAASTPNRTPTAATNAQAPRGNPIKVFVMSSRLDNLPLAFSSRCSGTICGRKACADISKITSQHPTPIRITINVQMEREPTAAEIAIMPKRIARMMFAITMSFLRSKRSMYTPAGSERTNHGTIELKLTPAISRSSDVRDKVSSGAAA